MCGDAGDRVFMGLEPIDDRLVEAIQVVDARGLSYADIRRALRPLAGRFGRPPPAYTTVRRIAIVERTAVDATTEAVDRIVGKLLQGRLPTPYELECLREARHYSKLIRTLVP
jgi:hypothetical protein